MTYAARWIWGFSLFSEFCLARGSRGDTGNDFLSGILGLVFSIIALLYLLTLFFGKKEDTSDWNITDWLVQILAHGFISIFASIPFMFVFGFFGMELKSIFGSWPILTAILTSLMIYLKYIKSEN